MKRRSKLSKRLKQWRRKLAQNRHIYLIVLLCLGVLGAGVWNASRDDGSPAQEVDFGDSLTSAMARSRSKASYDDALALANEGKVAEARMVMIRLAPLSEVAEQPLGHGEAHLWMAKYLLGDFNGKFLQVFPLDYYAGNPGVAPSIFRDEKVRGQITRHLEHAIALSPELEEGYLLLASMKMAAAKRKEAVSVLMRGLSYGGDADGGQVHDGLLFVLANTATFKGDDLALKEQIWHVFSTLGREVSGSNKAGLGERMEYAASALLLQKYEVVDIVVQKIERDFKNTSRGVNSLKVANSLRVATHYFRSIDLLNVAHESGDYSAVAVEVAAAQKLDPSNVHLIDALRRMASRYPALRLEIKALLEEGKQDESQKSGGGTEGSVQNTIPNLEQSMARTYFLLSELSDTPADNQRYLRNALESAPDDPEILLAYVQGQLTEDAPAYSELRKLLDRAAGHIDASFDQLAGLHLVSGQVFLGLDKKNAAIAAFEQALSKVENAEDKKTIHALLAKVYQQAGHPTIAAAHLERS